MSRPRLLLVAAVLPLLAGCAAGPSPAGSGWDALLRPRPEPLAGAPRVGVGEILLLPENPWGVTTPMPAAVGVGELVAAALLARRDVHFVERRRFAAAAERERRGLSRGPGAPPVGTSPGAELLLAGSWNALAGDSASLDLRLVALATGTQRAAWRVRTSRDVGAAALARVVTASLLDALDELEMRPGSDEPAPDASSAAGVPTAAFAAFLAGLAAEDAYRWTEARQAYERARSLGGSGFFEADEALARVARLRAGGSLGAS